MFRFLGPTERCQSSVRKLKKFCRIPQVYTFVMQDSQPGGHQKSKERNRQFSAGSHSAPCFINIQPRLAQQTCISIMIATEDEKLTLTVSQANSDVYIFLFI